MKFLNNGYQSGWPHQRVPLGVFGSDAWLHCGGVSFRSRRH
ncbi:hypothetical protein ACFFX0_31655 [Citricoccus parietis]|uniref:Uncharacterized protein n=1 Tax=Citricoccus parietis TaxID=592307 RepID=A0ABV5G960_9MICC